MSAPDVEEWLGELRALHQDLLTEAEGMPVYGLCCVDPRNFSPDPECSTEEERALHAADCARLERGESVDTPTRCEVLDLGNGRMANKMPTGYGLGVNTYPGNETAEEFADRLGGVLDSVERWFAEEYPK